MAWSPQQACRFEAAARSSRHVLAVRFMKRYDDGYRLAAEMVAQLGSVCGAMTRCVVGPNARYIRDRSRRPAASLARQRPYG